MNFGAFIIRGSYVSTKLSWKRKLATVKSLKAEASSVSPSSERLEELRVVYGFICGKWRTRINYLNEKCSLILRGLRVPIWKINFCSSVLRFSELPRCNWGKVADCHTLFRMIREIKVSSDWFGCVLVISFYFAKVFSESSPTRPLVSSGQPPCPTNWSTVSTKNGWEGKHWPHSIHSHISPSQPRS